MIKQEQPPTQAQRMQAIFKKLNVYNIDEILLSDNINVDFLAKTTSLHKNVVLDLLSELQQIINQPEDIVSPEKYSLNLKEIITSWVGEGSNLAALEKISDVQVGSAEIVEIIGRANGGKSFFCFQFCFKSLQKGLTVIFLDSNQNYQALCDYVFKRTKQDYGNSLIKKIIPFQFRTLSQFSILVHNLGNELIQQRKKNNSLIEKGMITVIDCLSRIEMADPDTDEQNSTMDFDIIERVKRLLVSYSTRVSSIVYTNRIPTAYSLFNTYYKNQKHRPRCKNNNAKLWDSISAKTIFVDYSRTMSNHEIKKIHLSKDFCNDVFTFEK